MDDQTIHGVSHLNVLCLKTGERGVVALCDAIPEIGNELDVSQDRRALRDIRQVYECARRVADGLIGGAKLVEISRPAGAYFEATAEGDDEREDGVSVPATLQWANAKMVVRVA